MFRQCTCVALSNDDVITVIRFTCICIFDLKEMLFSKNKLQAGDRHDMPSPPSVGAEAPSAAEHTATWQ